MEEFKSGDTVRLKSGGPIMTIESIKLQGGVSRVPYSAICIWFDDKNTLTRGVFKLDNLVLINQA